MPSATAFPLALDHIFVWVTEHAPEARLLEDAGLQRLQHIAQHRGQGTASCFFAFDNFYLELLWVDDSAQLAQAAVAMGFDLPSRAGWRETGASPFGIGLHQVAPAQPAPFATTPFSAAWMRPGTALECASDLGPHDPMIFIVPDYMVFVPDPLVEHALGIRRLTGARVQVHNLDELRSTTRLLAQAGLIELQAGAGNLLELTFDDASGERAIDLRPTLPLLLRY